MANGLNELFHETLKDIYFAEKEILKACGFRRSRPGVPI
jgi:ferritin-like metal-binding protein YciE